MSRLVIDASVLVKLFVNEIGSAEAHRVVKTAGELFAPDLLWAESGNILWKYARRGELTAEEVSGLLHDMLLMPIATIPSRRLVAPALEIAMATDRTVYDCLYLAAAVQTNGVMITADERLANALASTPLKKHVRCIPMRK